MKKKLTNKTNALPTANCQLPIAYCLLLIANCLLPIATFAQNTFRYQVCQDVGPLPRWNISTDLALHQVPSDSGYISFSSADLDAVRPNDTAGWGCFSATKLDKYGNFEWIRTYQDFADMDLTHKYPSDGIPTADSGFVMAGQKNYKGNPYYNGTNSYVQKMDKQGHLVWAKQYKITNNNENKALKILQMPDGGYIVMGQTKDMTYSSASHDSYNIYLLRLDKDGGKDWCYYYDAKKNGEEHPVSLDIAADGGFIIGGYSTVDAYYGFNQNTLMFGAKALMMKVSANGQTVEWARRYGEVWDGTYPISSDFFYDTKKTNDGGYISVGVTAPDGHDTKGWVVKTNAQGLTVWQKTYDTWSAITRVEILSDGYMLGSTEYEGDNLSGNGYGRMTKINDTGEVQWSKLYDKGITDLNLAMDGGFMIAVSGGQGASGTSPGKNIIKTNALAEFDNGCTYNGALSSWVDDRTDTAYGLSSVTSVNNLTPSDLKLKEFTEIRDVCPVICNISKKPAAPSYLYAGTACANTDSPININTHGDNKANFSHYKVNFGDPASGIKNNTQGSSMSDYGNVSHNYSNPGTYTVTLVVYNDNYSESDTVSANMVVVPKPKLTLLTPEINICKKDTVTITALADNYVPGVYAFNWTEENYYTSNNQTVLSQTNLVKDSTATITATVVADTSQDYYVITLSNAYTGGCRLSDTVRVKVGDNKAIITGNTQVCPGASTTLKASGGDNYLWSTGATVGIITVSPASNKTYWVEATTDDGCRDTGYVYVKIVPDINVEVFADRKNVCTGDTVKLYATGASIYTWNNSSMGDTTKVVASAGSNTFIVTGKSGSCTRAASIVIMADDKPIGVISGAPSSLCPGVEYTITASGGESYNWYYSSDRSNPIQKIKLNSSEYSNAVEIFKGSCSVTVEYNVPGSSVASIGGIEPDECRVCPGTEVTIRKYFRPIPSYFTDGYPDDNPNNQGLSYYWSTGQTTSNLNDSIKITVNRDTLITLTTTNSYGCSNTVSTLINVSPHFFFNKEVSPIASCGKSPSTLYLIGDPQFNFNFSWSNGSTNDTIVVSPSQDSMFYVTATVNGCTRTDSIWVMAKSNLPKAWINGDSIVCKGSPGKYFAKGDITPQSYKWLTGNNADIQSSLTTPIATNTTLKVVVDFSGACTDTAEYKIKVVDVPQALISGDTLICPGGTTSLKASGGYTYKWSDGSTGSSIDIKPTNDMTVSLYASAGNCSDTARVTVKTNQTITATIFSDEDTTCTGTPLTLIADGGDHYFWDNGEENQMLGILPVATTTYTVTVTTEDNCKDSKSITIKVSPAPIAQISSATVCQGDSLTLTASGGDNFLWNTGNVNASLILINPKADSVYRVKVSVGSCTDSTQAKVSVLPKPLVDAGTDVSINYGNDVPLFATGTGTYLWSPAAGLSCTDCASPLAEPSRSTLYYIILKDANGCKSTDSVMVFVDLPCGDVFVPTAFSPNNDGINDIFYIRGRCIQSMNLAIYDRWGEKVFEAPAGTTKGWDGTYNDKPMNPAMFAFSLEATLTNGDVLSRKGNIVLMR